MSTWFINKTVLESDCFYESALSHLDLMYAREITNTVVKDLNSVPDNIESKFGQSRKQIEWMFDVLSFGLSMGLSDIDIVRTCSQIYANFLNNYSTHTRAKPALVYEDREYFFLLFLRQLRNLFVPRPGANTHLHASLCSTVLAALRAVIKNIKWSQYLYDEVLTFFLTLMGRVLGWPPEGAIPANSLADSICDVLTDNFFYVWISISVRSFPTLSMWQSFSATLSHCLHNQQFVTQWSNLCLLLTKQVIKLFNLVDTDDTSVMPNNDVNDILTKVTDTDLLVHLWLKFLYSIGNPSILGEPTNLCHTYWPKMVAQEVAYFKTMTSDDTFNVQSDKLNKVLKYCNTVMPHTFFRLLRFLSSFLQLLAPHVQPSVIDFQDWYRHLTQDESLLSSVGIVHSTANRNRASRRASMSTDSGAKMGVFEYLSSSHFIIGSEGTSSLPSDAHSVAYAGDRKPSRITINTILDLVGEWILGSCFSFRNSMISDKIDYIIKQNYDLKKPTVIDTTFKLELKDSFEIGRAYAFNIMLRLFTTEPDNKSINRSYLSRFYVLLMLGLMVYKHKANLIFSSIILSSRRLFNCNLQDVEVLIPHYLRAIEFIVTNPDANYGCDIDAVTVRSAAVSILNSFITQALDVVSGGPKDISSFTDVSITYETMYNYIINILAVGFAMETNTENQRRYISGMTIVLFDFTYRVQNGGSVVVPVDFESDNFNSSSSISDFSTLSSSEIENSVKLVDVMLFNFSKRISQFLVASTNQKNPDFKLVLSCISFLEALSTIPVEYIHKRECIVIIIFMCDYIEIQAVKPPIHHSRDLHSCIVATYHCIISYINRHNWILKKPICLKALEEIVELGLSGSKSHHNADTASKENKVSKPISYRVGDAAEYLMLIMVEFNAFYQIRNTNYSPHLIETSLLHKGVEFFAIENSAIMSCVNVGGPNEVPSHVTVLRTPMGKHIFRFQYLPQFSFQILPYNINCDNPLDLRYCETKPAALKSSNMADLDLNMCKPCIADTVIPSIEEVIDKHLGRFNQIKQEYLTQAEKQNQIYEAYVKSDRYHLYDIRKVLPKPFTKTYESYRIMMRNLGLVRSEVIENDTGTSPLGGSVKLNVTADLLNDLNTLDHMSVRHTDFTYLFVISGNNQNLEEIIFQQSIQHSRLFDCFLRSLGKETVVEDHTGYLGPLHKKVNYCTKFLYFSDMMGELVVIPSYSVFSKTWVTGKKLSLNDRYETGPICYTGPDAGAPSANQLRHYSASLSKDTRLNSKITDKGVVLVWTEHSGHVPASLVKELVLQTNVILQYSDYHPEIAILMHPLDNDCVKLTSYELNTSAEVLFSPLCDGEVVNGEFLGEFIRHCITSYSLKRKLEIDMYNAPQLKRKTFIQSISKKYSKASSAAHYCANLINNSTPSTSGG